MIVDKELQNSIAFCDFFMLTATSNKSVNRIQADKNNDATNIIIRNNRNLQAEANQKSRASVELTAYIEMQATRLEVENTKHC